jgi:GAF domain-containing protein
LNNFDVPPQIANTANISALIYHTFKERTDVRKGVNWVGFYLNRKGNQLVLGPFQGKVACIRIPFGKGVCGDAAKDKQTKACCKLFAFSAIGDGAPPFATCSHIALPW